jgi:hypothetical protein
MFQRFFRAVSFRKLFAWTMVISSALGMTMLLLVTHTNRALGIDDHWFSLGDSLILTVMGQIAYMPVLVLAARLCPPGVEATLFALLMSVTNLAGLLSYELGAGMMHWLHISESNFTNLWLLVVLTNLSTLLPFPFLGLIPGQDAETYTIHSSDEMKLAGSGVAPLHPDGPVEANSLAFGPGIPTGVAQLDEG